MPALTPQQILAADKMVNRIARMARETHPTIYVAALVGLMALRCYNEAQGDMTRALQLADSLLDDVRATVFKINQMREHDNEKGRGIPDR